MCTQNEKKEQKLQRGIQVVSNSWLLFLRYEKYACIKKYGLSSPHLFLTWLRKYDSDEKVLPLQSEPPAEDMANRSKDNYKEENARLKKRIRELEKALEFSKLETTVRDMMIDKAEEYYEIPIRKKSGAK